jgi:hypothetical protein
MSNPKSPFTKRDLNLNSIEFEVAMAEMINKGLVTSFIKDGEVYYQLTDIGYAVGQHLSSDNKMVN